MVNQREKDQASGHGATAAQTETLCMLPGDLQLCLADFVQPTAAKTTKKHANETEAVHFQGKGTISAPRFTAVWIQHWSAQRLTPI